ncbi:DUF6338 family protein [Mycobacterium kyorinense]|uniref:Uncharacterized protein n=1 Tax=Mycobacterium kyorinense TaxID=487514 RepID=A0A1X1Y7W1_9MYCO|nr:DUF6338 family protein [Mycobacterium kyorinense]ORW07207.1 hypothetical protein AWC14_25035 [Mycobacterium kyorinense]
MVTTFQALLVAIIAVLPGAVYTLARESHGASWAWRKTDAATLIFRFLATSAAFQALLAPATYYAYRHVVLTGATAPDELPWTWWAAIAAYITIPYLVGVWMEDSRDWKPSSRRVIGWPKNAVKRTLAFISGTDPEPRAWDRLFSTDRTGYITLKLKGGEWKAGIWYRPAYASAYGEDQELYIAEQIVVSAEGAVAYDDNGDPAYLGVGLLIRWSEIEYVEFVDLSDIGG